MAKKVTYENSLKKLRPDLFEEWYEDKNTSLGFFADKLAPGSHKKVFWKCKECGNVWAAVIKSRSHGCGCPYCKGRKISEKKLIVKQGNSLAERFPKIASEWDCKKNNGLLPTEVNSGSSRKYWWKCEYGHSWSAAISNRTNSKHSTSCPYCSQETHTSFPEQAIYYYLSQHWICENRAIIDNKEIDIFIPEKKIGVEYDGRYYHPESTRNKEMIKDSHFKSLGITIIRIKESGVNLIEGNIIKYHYSSNDTANLNWAIEELLHILDFHLSQKINVEKDRLNIYEQYISMQKEKSLASFLPELADEWDTDSNNGITPDKVSIGSQKSFYWKCSKGHSYKAEINSRVRYYIQDKTFGCPYCSGHRVLPGFNDLNTLYPNIALEWNNEKNSVTPDQVTAGSHKKFWWHCKDCGYEWEATVDNRKNGRGCPNCRCKKISSSLIKKAANHCSFAEMFPELVCEWDPLNQYTPNELSPYSNKKIKWICSKCGYHWITTVSNRSNGNGCMACYKKSKKPTNTRSIRCIDTDEVFQSVAEAAKIKKIGRTSITNCLTKRSKHAGGFRWEYCSNSEEGDKERSVATKDNQ